MPRHPIRCVSVTAPARLHLGFLDLNGELGRRFGSLGLALERPCTRLRLSPAAQTSARGPDAERARSYAERLLGEFGLPGGVEIALEEVIPPHAGLGSGTQLALAVGVGLARLFELPVAAARVAGLLQRGTRSGVGIGAFEQGGFLVDGGRGEGAGPPPLICRAAFPADWRLLLVFDRARRGFSGAAERRAFGELAPAPQAEAARLCRLVLMQALPALAEADLGAFGAAIGEVQRRIGDHFAPVQGGRFASTRVAAVLQWLAERGIEGVGQSSWGPTGFALCASEAQARELLAEARRRWGGDERLSFTVCAARNHAAEVELTSLAPSRSCTLG